VLLFVNCYFLVAIAFFKSAGLFAYEFVSSAVNFPKEIAVTILEKFLKKLLCDFHISTKEKPLEHSQYQCKYPRGSRWLRTIEVWYTQGLSLKGFFHKQIALSTTKA
jgi:hypothetical protein